MAYGTCPMMGNYFGIGFGWIYHLLIIVLFFAVIWWMLNGKNCRNQTAEQILRKRLASGEISSKEYNRLKKEIE
ncbi:MAG: SHOCT domain-containing protein [Nanoarchaeota archaeon]